MNTKKAVWWVCKVLFLDDLLGLLFAIAAIAGIALLVKYLDDQTLLIVALCIYIPAVTFIGVYGPRKIRHNLDPGEPRSRS